MGLDSKVRESKESVFGEGHLLEAISDASWAGERDKKSMSAMTLFLNGNMIHASNRRQKSISLSSCESELHGSLAAVQEGIFLKRVLERLCGSEVLLQHRVDSSSCRAVISKQGLSKLRHVEIAFLWIQEKLKLGEFVTGAISTKFCPPDLLTKPTGGARTKLLCYMMGVVQNGEVIGQAEFDEELVRHELKRVVKVEKKSTLQAVRQVILSACVFMESTTLAEGHELSGMSTNMYCLSCSDLDLRLPLMNMAEVLAVVVLSLASLLLVTVLVVLVQQKLRGPTARLLRLPFQPFNGVLNGLIFLILSSVVPVATRSLESRSDEDMSPELAVYHQSQRRSWRSGSGDTTLINEMVMISPPQTEGTKTWLILVLLMVCALTVVLTSCWTASMVKGMLKKFLLDGLDSLPHVPNVPSEVERSLDPSMNESQSQRRRSPASSQSEGEGDPSEGGEGVVPTTFDHPEEQGVPDEVRDRVFRWLDDHVGVPARMARAERGLRAGGEQQQIPEQQIPQQQIPEQQIPQQQIPEQQIPQQQIPEQQIPQQEIPQQQIPQQQIPHQQIRQRHVPQHVRPNAMVQVGIFPAGRSYHRLTCGMVRSNHGRVRTVFLGDAVQNGKRPCRQCNPPVLG